ncbi:hypothetical protein CMI41_04820 [Candidatus Pacearchaeota archaeon]|jgi:hypothetical protein|nr:hypothetical protein [Candidatus Pacearchaeota archaeon]
MANEAVIIELLGNKGDPIQYNCADGDAFPKGTILKLSDNREADLSASDGDICAGICAMEKVASDGSTTVSAYTNGIFDLTEANSATIAVGLPVTIGGANLIKIAAAGEAETGDIFGHALASFAKQGTESVRVLI